MKERNVGLLGKAPKLLVNLKDEEIQEAGEKNYDPRQFLKAKGETDANIEKIIKYPKWIQNFAIGQARYKLKVQDKIMKMIDDGDTQIMKIILAEKNDDSEDDKKVVVTIGQKAQKYLK